MTSTNDNHWHQVPDLGQVQTNAADLNVLKEANLHPYLKLKCKMFIFS